MEILTKSSAETQALGRKFSQNLHGGEVLSLYGDLGSGKTTFVQGLAQGLGIKKRVLSPTFLIRRSYLGRLKLEHFDFYRLGPTDLRGLDLDDVAGDSGTVTIVEWPERVNFNLPQSERIEFEYVDEKTRKIIIL